ncbi:hypothetical protein NPIL_118221 [Nephila pilipes]|uniref:Uncharacterized protein n=1 Tax=Nephila pilipes TaxID=299642 RepID=A0A8X6UEP9_NEPPI|nr:hypothetical protein NPIL_118221 [Nephila pilipes]
MDAESLVSKSELIEGKRYLLKFLTNRYTDESIVVNEPSDIRSEEKCGSNSRSIITPSETEAVNNLTLLLDESTLTDERRSIDSPETVSLSAESFSEEDITIHLSSGKSKNEHTMSSIANENCSTSHGTTQVMEKINTFHSASNSQTLVLDDSSVPSGVHFLSKEPPQSSNKLNTGGFSEEERRKMRTICAGLAASSSRVNTSPSLEQSPKKGSMRRLCGDFQEFKKIKSMDLQRIKTKLGNITLEIDSSVKGAANLSKKLGKISKGIPETTSELKVQNARLKYLVSVAQAMLTKLNININKLEKEINDYMAKTEEINKGIDDRFKHILQLMIERSKKE